VRSRAELRKGGLDETHIVFVEHELAGVIFEADSNAAILHFYLCAIVCGQADIYPINLKDGKLHCRDRLFGAPSFPPLFLSVLFCSVLFCSQMCSVEIPACTSVISNQGCPCKSWDTHSSLFDTETVVFVSHDHHPARSVVWWGPRNLSRT